MYSLIPLITHSFPPCAALILNLRSSVSPFSQRVCIDCICCLTSNWDGVFTQFHWIKHSIVYSADTHWVTPISWAPCWTAWLQPRMRHVLSLPSESMCPGHKDTQECDECWEGAVRRAAGVQSRTAWVNPGKTALQRRWKQKKKLEVYFSYRKCIFLTECLPISTQNFNMLYQFPLLLKTYTCLVYSLLLRNKYS